MAVPIPFSQMTSYINDAIQTEFSAFGNVCVQIEAAAKEGIQQINSQNSKQTIQDIINTMN